MRVVKWELWCILKMVMGWKSGWGMFLSWQALYIVCCHTELPLQMAEVSWAWYCVTFVDGGGNDVMMACWKDWRLSVSLSSPHEPCMSWFFVIGVPVALVPDHRSGSCCMSFLM